MSRYDRTDPSLYAEYCDGLAPKPFCLCPDCLGTGRIMMAISETMEREADCPECSGRGVYGEA